MNNTAEITVIVCTWNRASSLRKTLDSFNDLDISGLRNVEIIVVDNNSTDCTKDVVEQAAANWNAGQLRYAFEGKQGKQFALNLGIQLAKYDILAFTDDDILFPKNWLQNIADLFEDATLDLAGGKTVIVWPETGQPDWYDPSMLAILAGVDLGDSKLNPPPPGYAPAGSNMIARRSLFERVGMFSESHFRHMDFEFGQRSAKAQVNIVYDPSILVYAPVDEACLTKRYFRRWSFKAGISNDNSNNTTLAENLSIPLWVFRQIFEDAVFLLSSYLRLKVSASAFKRELRLWKNFGLVTSRLYKKLTPNYYLKWVEKYSQKKNNVY